MPTFLAFLRVKENGPPPPEPQPDVKQMVRENLDSVFVASSNPRAVQVSPPHPEISAGQGWIACVPGRIDECGRRAPRHRDLPYFNRERRDTRSPAGRD